MPEILEQGYLALPSSEQRVPAVMVLPAWWGLNAFFKQLCDRLAQLGYVAFAPDLYSGKVAETIEQAEVLRDGLDNDQATTHLRGCIEALRRHSRSDGQPIGIIGFSVGAFQGLYLLQEIPDQMKALVIFYGTCSGYCTYQNTQAAVLGHFAETDEYEPPSDKVELEKVLKAAGVETTFYTYPGTVHWFFESNQPKAYKADAADLAWERTVAFFKKHL